MTAVAMYLFSWVGGDAQSMAAGGFFLFLSVATVSVFSFVSVAVWTDARRREREAYYKSESLRRIAEMPVDAARQVIEMVQEEERLRQVKAQANVYDKVEGIKLGGLVTMAVGVALTAFLYFVSGNGGVALVGLIPGLIGLVLLVYALFLAPRRPTV